MTINYQELARKSDKAAYEQFRRKVNEYLSPATGSEPWESDNRFMLAGRRPLRKFPKIFLSPGEWLYVINEFEQAGIPAARVPSAFVLVEAKLDDCIVAGKNPKFISVFGWLVGWVKQQLIDGLIKEHRLKKILK